jgi:hypothetical protein
LEDFLAGIGNGSILEKFKTQQAQFGAGPRLFLAQGGWMHLDYYYIVFPEGDTQEVPRRLPFGAIVDMNGNALEPPFSNPRVIAYRVGKVRSEEERGETRVYHYLELLSVDEIRGL